MRSSHSGILVLYSAMIITAIPPISGFGSTVTMAGMAFASLRPTDPRTWSQSLSQLAYGWAVASIGLVLSATTSLLLLRRVLSRLHGQWGVLSTIKKDRRFRALRIAVHEHGLWMAVLSR